MKNDALSIGFYGAAGEVTGSRHLVRAGGASLLLDCGLFQGRRAESVEKNRNFGFSPASVSAVALSHAHIDHSGSLPLLYKNGAAAPIYCSRPTAELAGIMLKDSARLQRADAEFYNKIHADEGLSIEPLYDEEDAEKALSFLRPVENGAPTVVDGSLSFSFHNAGHVLGSSMVLVDASAGGARRRVLYTGDLGRRKALMMRPPSAPEGVDYLVIESTYGNRLHEPAGDAEARMADIIRRAAAEKGKILIPSFALERTQELVFILDKLRKDPSVPKIPIYVDSPMAVSITELFNRYKEDFSFDDGFRDYIETDEDPFGYDYIKYLRTKEQSQALNEAPGPMMIISASGMCEGGRILHHLRNSLDKENVTLLFVGYQAGGTLGRRLADGEKKVKIFGMQQEVACRVEAMHFFSSHADKDDLTAFIKAVNPARGVFLVHGDPRDRQAFAEYLTGEAGVKRVTCPSLGQEFPLD